MNRGDSTEKNYTSVLDDSGIVSHGREECFFLGAEGVKGLEYFNEIVRILFEFPFEMNTYSSEKSTGLTAFLETCSRRLDLLTGMLHLRVLAVQKEGEKELPVTFQTLFSVPPIKILPVANTV